MRHTKTCATSQIDNAQMCHSAHVKSDACDCIGSEPCALTPRVFGTSKTINTRGVIPAHRLARRYIDSLFAFRSLRDFKIDLLAFFQCFETIHLDRRKVSKQIFTTVVRGDKSKSLCIVEPFNGSRSGGVALSVRGAGRIRHRDCLFLLKNDLGTDSV